MGKSSHKYLFFTYLSVSISSLVKLLAIETNNFFSLILLSKSMVPDLACFASFLAHDHESVYKKDVFLFCGIKIAYHNNFNNNNNNNFIASIAHDT